MSSPSWLVLAVLLVSWTALPSESYLLRRQSRQPCPEVATKLDFDYRQFAGLWYEIYRFDNVFESGSSCERAIYEEIAENLISVVNTAVLEDGTLYNITGTARPIAPDRPGFLIVSFPGRPDGIYLILDTSYTEWASTYSCTTAGIYAFEYAWILHRENVMPQADLERALAAFSQFGVDVGKFELVTQGEECIYYPEYPFPEQ